MLQVTLPHSAPRCSLSSRSGHLSDSLRDALMVAIQVLLDSAVDAGRDRYRVLGFRAYDEADGLQLTVAKGTDSKASVLVVPIINKQFTTTIHWIFQGSTASAARAGGVSAAYWAPKQSCQMTWSKELVFDQQAIDPSISSADCVAAIGCAPDVPVLVLNGEPIELPGSRHCSQIFRALSGEAPVVSSQDLDTIERFMACGLPLCSGHNPNQVGILDAFVLMKSRLFS